MFFSRDRAVNSTDSCVVSMTTIPAISLGRSSMSKLKKANVLVSQVKI